jgi:hypothetical protein
MTTAQPSTNKGAAHNALHAAQPRADTTGARPLLRLDRREARRFLDALCGGDSDNKWFVFQTFDDNEKRKNPALVSTYTIPFANLAAELERRNQGGAGVFVTIAKTDGQGRRNKNVRSVRALFVDLDGAPVEPVQGWVLKPHIVVESSPNRFHGYWRHDGSVKLEDFGRLQAKLAAKFDADQSVTDLARVMRLPGAWHRKGEPFQTRIVSIDNTAPAYSLEDFERALADVEVPHNGQGKPKREPKPRAHCSAAEWVNQEAMHRIADWAPELFPGGRFGAQGEWRVPSSELRRHCQEDLAIHPDGIRDFGTAWDGHPADTYTPIQLIAAFFNQGADGGVELVTEFDEFGSPQDSTMTHDAAARVLAEALELDWDAAAQGRRGAGAQWFQGAAGRRPAGAA